MTVGPPKLPLRRQRLPPRNRQSRNPLLNLTLHQIMVGMGITVIIMITITTIMGIMTTVTSRVMVTATKITTTLVPQDKTSIK